MNLLVAVCVLPNLDLPLESAAAELLDVSELGFASFCCSSTALLSDDGAFAFVVLRVSILLLSEDASFVAVEAAVAELAVVELLAEVDCG